MAVTGWSTRELADLAGTTLRAVRHYHEVGLLAEPERGANGYKQYQVSHLLRLIRITRLAELGVPLSQIAALADDAPPRQTLAALDAELGRSIERQQRLRDELAILAEGDLPVDLSVDLASSIDGLSAPTRALMVLYGRLLDERGRDALRRFLAAARREPVDVEFDALAPDADEPTRADVASRLTPRIRALLVDHGELLGSEMVPAERAATIREAVARARAELYNPAQLDVLARTDRALQNPPPVDPDHATGRSGGASRPST